jgi:NodT family efflux transporter outer membrane factor (OMF) lipoprotein
VRNTVAERRAQAQASAADLETVSLSLHAELALDYFELRGLDTQKQLLDSTTSTYQQALQLTENLFKGGLASGVDVAQARTQLETTKAQDIDVGVQRAQFEHAIAVLTGQPASGFSVPWSPLVTPPPAIPVGLPSELLERRPDIASAERLAAAANAQMGVARAAYFPILNLTASGGFESIAASTWLSGPSGLMAAGAASMVTVFDGGRRRAISDQARSAYNESVDSYRQTVLTAIQEVEDNLAALRILEGEATTEDGAVASAENSLALSENRYKGGVVSYLEVTTAQSVALADRRSAVDILTRRMTASVLLIKVLGGGWDKSQLPQI